MGLTEDEYMEMITGGSQDDPWTADDIQEFMAVHSGDAWVIIT